MKGSDLKRQATVL